MQRWLRRAAIPAGILILIVLIRFTVFAPEPVPVEVVTVAPGPVEETVTNSQAGTVRARKRAKLSPEVGGTVVAIPFREGQRVFKGAVVLRLDDSLQRAELTLAERELETASAQQEQACLAAERAAREKERIARLALEGIASQDLLDQTTSQADRTAAACEAAGAGVERARAAVALAHTKVDKAVLRAPFDGIVAEVSAEVGEWVSPSPPALPIPPVVDILDPDSIYISAPMDEVDSAQIASQQPARVTVDSYRGRNFTARVVRVAPYVLDVEAQNRTVEIEVELENMDTSRRLLPGTSADVEVILQEKQDVLRVPTQALLEGNRVLVVENGRLATRDVETGLSNWDFTEIVSGLTAGDEIVVTLDRPEVQPGAPAVIEKTQGAP
ncbi:MAG TPA: efflux RND transporter periplasmic adaptor subunit [Vicinamibacteria bacterium]|nr:efflux RND transporter periplasmic adaptor subunit [Vicinamibacteria bacterium]